MRAAARRIVGTLVMGASATAGAWAAGSGPSAEDALTRLKEGNGRFVADARAGVAVDRARRETLVAGQEPFAIVLSCADSRVPPEHVFNVGLGELFVVRTAGEVADKAVLASVEYAAEHLHAPLLLVMGHESCGAVKAASAPSDGHGLGPNLDYLVEHIKPAVQRTQTEPEAERLRAAILANVEEVINDVLAESQLLSSFVSAGRLQVVGGYYELASGRVMFTKPIKAGAASPTAAHAR